MPWLQHNPTGFHYKTMAYQQSCFPCSLHIILANLGYAVHDGNGIENLWNQLQMARGAPAGASLNTRAPDEFEVHENITNTPNIGNRGVVFSPAMFQNQNDATNALARVTAEFIQSPGRAGMILGVNHAEVFYKLANGTFVHLHTAPNQNDTVVTAYNALGAVVAGGENNWAVVLRSNNQNILAGNFIMIIR